MNYDTQVLTRLRVQTIQGTEGAFYLRPGFKERLSKDWNTIHPCQQRCNFQSSLIRDTINFNVLKTC